jgi:hypothetical protein
MQFYIDEQLVSIKQKLQLLLKKHESLEKENRRLIRENEKLKADSDASKLLPANKFLPSLANMDLDTDEKKALAQKIDGYLREIDKCLTLLNP